MQSEEQTKDVDSYRNTLMDITPSIVATKIAVIPDEVMLLTEEKLEHHARVEDTERRLRAAFQIEYDRATRTNTKMEMMSVYKGIVTISYFQKYVVGNSYKLAYMIKPYTDIRADQEDILRMGLDEMRKLMKKSSINAKGEVDYKLASIKLGITKDLLDRTRGSAARHLMIDQKSMVVTKDITEPKKAESIEELNERIRQLEAQEVQQITYKDVSKDGHEEI